MTEQSEWICSHCNKPAVELESEGVPRCSNEACPYHRSIIPNYIH